MRFLKIFTFVLVFPILAYTSMHKYYISVTQVNYIKEKKSVQITSRIFIDDFERLLKANYNESIELGKKDESKSTDEYIQRYLKEKIMIKINNEDTNLTFIGKEYDGDIMRCYLEIEGVKKIKSLKVINNVFFDLYDDQQNIVKIKINDKLKSFMLTSQNNHGTLNFD